MSEDFRMGSFDLPRVPSVADLVYDALQTRILDLDLLPGAKITEIDIARQFDVSRQPVRDAFHRLFKRGFISIRPQRATLVTQISERAVREAAFIRTALEKEAMLLAAANFTTREFDILEELLAMQEARIASGQLAGFADLDDQFHQKICVLAGQGYVWALVSEIKGHMDRLRRISAPEVADIALEGHRAILSALKARDGAEAGVLISEHLAYFVSTLPMLRARHPEYFE